MGTKFDVRITQHKATRSDSKFVTIAFYDGLQNLIGTDYVKLDVKDSRLYFYPSEKKVKGALKLNPTVIAQKNFEKLLNFVGTYPLDFDTYNEVYYVDLTKKGEVSIQYGNSNVPHPNYKPHKNLPYESEEEMITKVTEVEVIDAKYPVYEALMALLMSQIKNKEYATAVFTVETIRNMLERE